MSERILFNHRCYGCFRPAQTCICDQIPLIENVTGLLIVQHTRERRHAFNTARIVARSLVNSIRVSGFPAELANQRLPIEQNAALLFPGQGAVLSDMPADQHPQQLVVIDGTWHHAKTIIRDVPQLRQLPRVQLKPMVPGRFRIRREPTSESLSTLEAVAMALEAIEPDTSGLPQLVEAFDSMVERQLAHPHMNSHWRKNARRQSDGGNIPKVLTDDSRDVVVAYGESARIQVERGSLQVPVYWAAQRFRTGESFVRAIATGAVLHPSWREHSELTSSDFEDACSIATFKEEWNSFLRPTDTLAVYHQATIDLLRNIGARHQPQLILKSIRCGSKSNWRVARSLDEIVDEIPAPPAARRCKGRAGERLANAVALVEYLRRARQSS